MKWLKNEKKCILCSLIYGIFGAIWFILLIYDNIIGTATMSIMILMSLIVNIISIKNIKSALKIIKVIVFEIVIAILSFVLAYVISGIYIVCYLWNDILPISID